MKPNFEKEKRNKVNKRVKIYLPKETVHKNCLSFTLTKTFLRFYDSVVEL